MTTPRGVMFGRPFPVVLSWVVLVTLAAVLVASILTHSPDSPTRLGGDLPAFYGAGSIVLEGDVAELYDPQRQAEAQRGLVPGGGYLHFAYPPPVAAFYAPVAALPYRAAYALQMGTMAAALFGAFWCLRDLLPNRRPHGVVIAAVVATYLPITGSVALGQNIAVVILSFAATWRLAANRQDLAAGLALGLALFKPQYAIPIIGLFLVRRRWGVVAGALFSALGWWGAGALMLGWAWPIEWLSAALEFSSTDIAVNGPASLSLIGMTQRAVGIGEPLALAVGGVLALAVAGLLVWIWSQDTRGGLELPFGAAASGVLLISPHAVVMDAGLLVLTVAGLAIADHPRLRELAAALWLLGAAQLGANLIGHTPLAAAVVLAFLVAAAFWFTTSRRSVTNPSHPA